MAVTQIRFVPISLGSESQHQREVERSEQRAHSARVAHDRRKKKSSGTSAVQSCNQMIRSLTLTALYERFSELVKHEDIRLQRKIGMDRRDPYCYQKLIEVTSRRTQENDLSYVELLYRSLVSPYDLAVMTGTYRSDSATCVDHVELTALQLSAPLELR
jgi:ribosomal protein L20